MVKHVPLIIRKMTNLSFLLDIHFFAVSFPCTYTLDDVNGVRSSIFYFLKFFFPPYFFKMASLVSPDSHVYQSFTHPCFSERQLYTNDLTLIACITLLQWEKYAAT